VSATACDSNMMAIVDSITSTAAGVVLKSSCIFPCKPPKQPRVALPLEKRVVSAAINNVSASACDSNMMAIMASITRTAAEVVSRSGCIFLCKPPKQPRISLPLAKQ